MGPDCKPVLKIPNQKLHRKIRKTNKKQTPPPSPKPPSHSPKNTPPPSPKPTEKEPTLSDLKPTKEEIREVMPELNVPEIVLPEPIHVPPYKKVKSEMDFFSEYSNNFEKYEGRTSIGNIYYIYLLNKYRSKCLIYDLKDKYMTIDIEDDSLPFYKIGLEIKILENPTTQDNLGIYRHMNNVAKTLVNCVKNRSETVIIPLIITYMKTKAASHANLLIYRRSENVIERFEPHGNEFRGQGGKKIEDGLNYKLFEFCAMVNTEFDKYKIPRIRFKPASEVCPINGIQSLEEIYNQKLRERGKNEGGGYCQVWSMFFAELVLNNPTIPSNELFELVLQNIKGKEGHEYLVKIAKGYAYHVSTKIEKYFSILFGEKELYSKIINHDKNFRKKFNKYLFYLAKIEMKANMDPRFNAENEIELIQNSIKLFNNRYNQIQIDKKTKQLTYQQNLDEKIYHYRLESLQTELAVYEKLGVLKEVSPEREVVYNSPKKPYSKSNKEKRNMNASTKKIKQILDVVKNEVVIVK
jgi:hypothetical protein